MFEDPSGAVCVRHGTDVAPSHFCFSAPITEQKNGTDDAGVISVLPILIIKQRISGQEAVCSK